MADISGAVLGTVSDGVFVDIATSWAAEWCGKLAGVSLATTFGVPDACRVWAVAHNVAAVLGVDGGRPSASHVVDLIRLAYASATSTSPLQEGFTPPSMTPDGRT